MNGISEEKYTHIDEIKEQTKAVFDELMEQAKLEEGDILVVGCSSSEIASHKIGSYSSEEIGEAVAQTFLNCCKEKKIYLAAQCCEHLNRAIIIEKAAAKEYRLPMVNVVPKLKAGGSFATAVYAALQAPVAVEAIQAHAGIDIGDTLIIGFSLLNCLEFFVFRKMKSSSTINHPLCGCESNVIQKKLPFRVQ